MGKRVDWGSILRILKESKLQLINWCPSVDFPTHKLQKTCTFFWGMINMLFNPDPAHRLHLILISGKSQGLFHLVMVLTQIIQAPITDATPMIVNSVMLSGVWHGLID